jgi:alkylation response protein AidB-like acyl-CoA dehydrogenase
MRYIHQRGQRSVDEANESRQIYEHFRAIGERHAAEVYQCWIERSFPQALWNELGEEGILSVATSRGRGLEAGSRFLAPVMQGVTNATFDGGFMISVAVHGVFGLGLIDLCASEPVRSQYLDRLCSGKELLAFGVTEHHGGTDALNPSTRAIRYSPELVKVTGRKWHITNAPIAGVILALARDEQDRLVFAIVDRHLDGVTIGEPLAPAGARTSPVAEIVFDGVVIPAEHVFRPVSGGVNMLRKVLTAEKILGAFPAIGMMERVTQESVSFVRSRSVNGRALFRQQLIQYRLTEMQISLETVRGFAQSTLERFARGEDVTLEAAALKLQAMRMGVETGINAIQACGSYGLQEQSRLPMAMLDRLSGTIGGGTEEAQRMVVITELAKKLKPASPPDWAAETSPAGARFESDLSR